MAPVPDDAALRARRNQALHLALQLSNDVTLGEQRSGLATAWTRPATLPRCRLRRTVACPWKALPAYLSVPPATLRGPGQTSEHGERQDDATVLRLLVIAAQQVGDGPDEDRKSTRLN